MYSRVIHYFDSRFTKIVCGTKPKRANSSHRPERVTCARCLAIYVEKRHHPMTDTRTDEHVIAEFMEGKPDVPPFWSEWWSRGWWTLIKTSGGGMEWIPPVVLDLDRLRLVEERLTDEQWWKYQRNLCPHEEDGRNMPMWIIKAYIHASAEQKLAALAAVLRESAR